MEYKKLYVTHLNGNNALHASKLETYLKNYMNPHFDMVDIIDYENIDIKNYDIVLINAIILVSQITKIDRQCLYKKLEVLSKTKHIVMLLHDLHDYSFDLDKNIYGKCIKKIKGKCVNAPILSNTAAKKLLHNFFIKNNIKYLISIYDCAEYNYFTTYFRSINNFYLINHAFPAHIFKPLITPKSYDILFYGTIFPIAYPFRCRLCNIAKKSNLRLKIIRDGEKICEDQLCHLINQSWMCIACVSNFSYFVRKYLEISACNSVVVGNINRHGFNIIGNNMIIVDEKMTDAQILEKIKYYLDNKEILAAMSFNKLETIEKETYELMAHKLNEICSSILNNSDSEYSYPNKFLKELNPSPLTRHSKEIINITFKIDNGVMKSNEKVNAGLYTCVVHDIDYILQIYDADTDKELGRSDTLACDITSQNITYIPFKVHNLCYLKLTKGGESHKKQIEFYHIY